MILGILLKSSDCVVRMSSLTQRRAALNKAYRAYGAKIGWKLSTLSSEAQHDGSFHIELTENAYHWAVTERGLELERLVFETAENLLEHIFIHITFWSGVEYEVQHRDPKKDPRRMIYQHQLSLLEKLNSQWQQVAQAGINATLHKHPYSDPV